MRAVIFIMAALLAITAIFADGTYNAGENLTRWYFVINGTTYQNVHEVNVSLIAPNGSFVLNNVAMQPRGNGTYTYTIVPNATGVYGERITAYSTPGVVYRIGADTFTIVQSEESQMTSVAIVIGFIAIISYFLYLSKDFYGKPKINKSDFLQGIHKKAVDIINPATLGLITYIIAGIMVIGFAALLAIMSRAYAFVSLMETIFIVVLILIGFTLVAYLAFFILYTYISGIESFQRVGRKR